MDPDLISEKLESLRRCLQRVQKKCPATPEELMEDPDLQDIISLNLTRAVQLCVAAVYFLRLRAIALALRGPPAISQIVALSAVTDRRYSACAGAR